MENTIFQNHVQKQEVEQAHSVTTLEPPFYIAGTVIRGDGRASKLGFPTINLNVTQIRVPHGVYVVLAHVKEQTLKGVAHVGAAETFNIAQPRCEVHLFNFEGNLYHKRVELNLLHFLRDVKKFSGKDELVAQIQRDVEIAKNFLRHI